MLDFLNFDPATLMEQLKNPLMGLQILGALLLVNVFLGVILAKRQGVFDRAFLLDFAKTRLFEQMLPAAAAGLGAVYLNMPIFLAVYGTVAAFMVYDLTGDIKEKVKALWTRKAGGGGAPPQQ